VTSSVHSPVGDLRRTSSPKGDASQSTLGVSCAESLLVDIKWSGYRASPKASPLGEALGALYSVLREGGRGWFCTEGGC